MDSGSRLTVTKPDEGDGGMAMTEGKEGSTGGCNGGEWSDR